MKMGGVKKYRVQKLICNSGYCSRRKAEELIDKGKVKVNDKIINLGARAKESDKIYVDGKLLKCEKKVYLMFNKPIGCVTALRDAKYKTVMDYIKIKERIFPIGRLDYNTSGLLLLTNDGDYANRIMHPRYETNKKYVTLLDKKMPDKDMKNIEKGITLEDGRTSPAKIKRIKEKEYEITIHEGKKRIIRRMFNTLGYTVKSLKRVRVGKLDLGDLKEGKFRELNEEEIKKAIS